MSVHIQCFIDLKESNQLTEIREYLKSVGADIAVENNGTLSDNLNAVIRASTVCWKQPTISNNDLEMLFNGITSLVILVPAEKVDPLIDVFCETLFQTDDVRASKAEERERRIVTKLCLAHNLFHGVTSPTAKCTVYTALICFASATKSIEKVGVNMDELKMWLTDWHAPRERAQSVWRTLYEAFVANGNAKLASRCMIELLETETDAATAKTDAQKCVITYLNDSGTLLFDHLLAIKPVAALKGEPVFDLLQIFVGGMLKDYLSFAASHADFLTANGLSNDACIFKMRILTMMQLAETGNIADLPFATLERELNFTSADQLEEFLVEAIRLKVAAFRIDDVAQAVHVNSVLHRRFGMEQWKTVAHKLRNWLLTIGRTRANLEKWIPTTNAPTTGPAQQSAVASAAPNYAPPVAAPMPVHR